MNRYLTEDPWQILDHFLFEAERPDETKINTIPYGICPPGTVKFYKPIQETNGIWTFRFEYRPEGWCEETDE